MGGKNGNASKHSIQTQGRRILEGECRKMQLSSHLFEYSLKQRTGYVKYCYIVNFCTPVWGYFDFSG